MTAPVVEDLDAAFALAYRDATDSTRRGAQFVYARLLAYLDTNRVDEVDDLDAATLTAFVTSLDGAATTHAATMVRRTLGVLDPALLHPTLLIDGEFDWSHTRPATAVALARAGRRTWVDPAAYPAIPATAAALTSLLAQVPDHYSGSYADEFGRALRSVLGWLDTCPAPPARLHWITADLLDGWIAHLAATRPSTGRSYGSRVRDLLTNRPSDVALHGSLLAADGVTLIWEPEASATVKAADDLPFATVAAVHHAARDQVRRAVARISTLERAARHATPADTGGSWHRQADVWATALAGRLDTAALIVGLGDDPDGWPAWLADLIPDRRPAKSTWATAAVTAVHQQVFPSALEVTAGYVLMLLATGLPPESVMALERDWFLVAGRPDGSYGPVCRLRYPKDRAGGPTQARLYTTRSQLSPLRVRDLVDRMTRGLRALPDAQADRLWVVLSPGPQRYGRRPQTTTLNQVQLAHPYRNGGAGAFTVWIATHGIDDPDRIAAWNDERAADHARRLEQHRRRAAARGTVVGMLGPAPFRAYAAWPGRVAPQRLRKTIRVRDLVLHGPDGAARDHTTLTLLKHYTASEALQVVAATAIRDAQAALEAFASDPSPKLLVADTDRPTAVLAPMLDLEPAQVEQLLTDDATQMTNGLVCTTPTAPPDEQPIADDGWCAQLGTRVCTSCPAAVAVPAGVDALWQELRRSGRTAHVVDDNPAVTRATDAYRRTLLDLLDVLDPDRAGAYRDHGQLPTPVEPAAPVIPRRRRRA